MFKIPTFFMIFALLVAGCAPVAREDSNAGRGPASASGSDLEAEAVLAEATRAADIRMASQGRAPDQPDEPASLVPRTEAAPRPAFDPNNPDWELRYRMLYDQFLSSFEPPALGQRVDVTLATGQGRQGVLEDLTDDRLVLNIGAGSITLSPESLNEHTRARFFADDHARLNALARGRAEHAAWRERQEAARRPPPQARQPEVSRVGPVDIVDPPRRRDPNAPPPRNEGSSGRVAQVDQYIRQNAAIPHSLRFESWGRVQPHGDGYVVRVRYSVQGADGFGRSNEDMLFYMHSDGTVYRRAPYRGN